MKSNVYSKDGNAVAEIELPRVFETVPREDIIRRAFRAVTLSMRHPYGTSPTAGLRRVGHNYGPGHGIARLPRVAGSTRGVILANMVGGRSAHAPTTQKVLVKRFNRKELRMAKFSAIALTAVPEKVRARGHRVPEGLSLPVVVKDDVVEVSKAKDAMSVLSSLGLDEDVMRAKEGTKIRAGRGKMRGRTYREPKSILIVCTDTRKARGFKSLPGVDVANVSSLGIRHLAPGGVAGRLTLFTESAIRKLSEVE
ncbi:50S ribosomal protein L4 [Thermogymnomonas acidicola]|uniref:Large ribosomal subunit protein uL4 n=1 Tax=Thermogymnomonas acidicola TaxID=399579 RepID=A0AA37BQW2_9ARCH|nr:50S ribosomal protein L4 [Thermogymnomonas acidicola]